LARKTVAAFAQNRSLAQRIGADDSGGVGNMPRTRSYRSRHLDFCRLARGTAALIYVHVAVIVRPLHLRSDRSSLAQQQAGYKDDDKAIPRDEFHKSPSLSSDNYSEPHHRGPVITLNAPEKTAAAFDAKIRTPNEAGGGDLRPLQESFRDLLEIPQIRRPLIFFGGHQETVGAQDIHFLADRD
jgi:hypothetical protein